jgi:uncharacterized protein (DUF697 family)
MSDNVIQPDVAAATRSPGETTDDRDPRLARGSRIIATAVGWSVAAGIIPVPFVDLAALAAVQVKMISDLGDLYGQPLRKEAVRSAVSVLLGVLLPGQLAAAVGGSGAKLVPGIGSVTGAVSLSAFGAAASYAIGKVFLRHFARGGTLATFQPDRVENELKEEFRAARNKPQADPQPPLETAVAGHVAPQ